MADPSNIKSIPRRCIFNDADMEAWKTSSLKSDLLKVVGAMGKSCSSANFQYDDESPLNGLSPAMAALHGSLTQMYKWLEEDIPPLELGSATIRFGNPAFKTWHARLKERSLMMVMEMYHVHKEQTNSNRDGEIIPGEQASRRGAQAAAASAPLSGSNLQESDPDYPILLELSCYLHDAFGHPVRLDYGTGHESSFMIFLYAAIKLGFMDHTVEDPAAQPPSMEKLKATTLSIFNAYLKVTRQLQMQYRLEPAGSHGVWGLDDYHCLPFYFGACQLSSSLPMPDGDETPKPSDITDERVRKRYASTLLYFGCMDYICTLKRGAPLFECSPMLYDISQTCPTWSKVSSGLLKLYQGEVLDKRQVVQHFVFGDKLFKATWEPSQAAPNEAPTTNFRTPTGAAVGPMVRAPWEPSEAATRLPGGVPDGRAPWAASNNGNTTNTGGSEHPAMPPPTKAPWTKK